MDLMMVQSNCTGNDLDLGLEGALFTLLLLDLPAHLLSLVCSFVVLVVQPIEAFVNLCERRSGTHVLRGVSLLKLLGLADHLLVLLDLSLLDRVCFRLVESFSSFRFLLLLIFIIKSHASVHRLLLFGYSEFMLFLKLLLCVLKKFESFLIRKLLIHF